MMVVCQWIVCPEVTSTVQSYDRQYIWGNEISFWNYRSINPDFKKLSPERYKPIKTDLLTAYLRQTYLEPHSSLNCSFIEVLSYWALITNCPTLPFIHWRWRKISQLSVWRHPTYLLGTQAMHNFSQLNKTMKPGMKKKYPSHLCNQNQWTVSSQLIN